MSPGPAVHVITPASTANLGPGFDVLGLAVDLPFHLWAGEAPPDALVCDEHHPAHQAFLAAGGRGPLWWRSPIPPGRGLGFSAAARVAGAAAGQLVRDRGIGMDELRDGAFALAAELEGHPDNAAPSAYGGLTVSSAGLTRPAPVADGLSVVAWIPGDTTTSTDTSRTTLPTRIPHEDAAFNVGRAILLVLALGAGDLELVARVCEDRLHEDVRFAAVPESRAVRDRWRAAGLGPWLSGSGPTVATVVDDARAASVPEPGPGGRLRWLEIDRVGLRSGE